MSAQPKHYIPLEDYLIGERISDQKHEYYDGDIYALAGGSRNHNIITGNVFASFHAQVRGRECTTFSSDMRVKAPRPKLYAYPDVAVVCGKPRFDDEHQDILINPTLLVEVLSPSTENFDRGKKFHQYRTLSSFKEYLLIAQDEVYVEQYLRQANDQWLLTEYLALEDTIVLVSINCKLSLRDIYERISFDQENKHLSE